MASYDEQAAFAKRYAPLAVEQQIKYGIPASVTLAQMAVESGWDKSGLAEKANNCFGITAGSHWKGPTVPEFDDNQWKQFRAYGSKNDSVEDHSRLLLSANYMRYCGNLSSTDHLGWIKGIKAAGYATDPNYVSSIEGVIKSFGFDKLDQYAVEEASRRGVRPGYMRGRQNDYQSSTYLSSDIEKRYQIAFKPGIFSLPMDNNNMIVTSERGQRDIGLKGASRNHKGLDIQADHVPLFATEDNGKVLQAGFIGKGGNTVSIEYDRPDNSKVIVTYMHLSKIMVQPGDMVHGHQQIGISGATGNVSGPHLHFQTDFIDPQGNKRNLDSAAYLAEISLRTNMPVRAVSEKTKMDLVAPYRAEMTLLPSPTQQSIADTINSNGIDNEEERRRRALQDGESQGPTGDLLGDLIGPLFKSALTLAIQLSNSEEEDIPKEVAAKQAEKEIAGTLDKGDPEAYHRTRDLDPVDSTKLAHDASAIYESENPSNQQQQENQVKLS